MADKSSEKAFKAEIRTEAWNYLKERNLKFYTTTHRGWVSSKTAYAIPDNPQMFEKIKSNGDGYPEHCYKVDDFLASLSSYSSRFMPQMLLSDEEDHKVHSEFFIHCYNKFPQHQKLLLGDYTYFHKDKSISTSDFLFSIVDQLSSDKKEKTKLIQKFPISTLSIHHLELANLEQYLTKNNLTREEFDKFLLSYLKPRKNQLNDAKWGVKVRDFLLNRFNHNSEALKPYMEFFSFLKAMYEIPKANFILNEESLSTVATVSCKKMKKSFLLDNWEPNNYYSSLIPIVNGMVKYFNLSRCELDEKDKAEKIYQIVFFHNNPLFTKEVFETTLVEYFQFLFDQKCQQSAVTPEHFTTWIAKRDLHAELSKLEVNTTASKKMKI